MHSSLQVFLFATGENEKLAPLSDKTAACMLPVANRPIMEYTIEQLARQGYKHFLVGLYDQAYQIEKYFGSGRRWGVSLDYHLQREAFGTAGSIKRSAHSLNGTFLFIPADMLVQLDVESVLQQHRKHSSNATIIYYSSPPGKANPIDTSQDGQFLTADQQPEEARLKALTETGIFLFEPEVLDFIPARTPYDISRQLIPALQAAGKTVTDYVCSGYVNRLDTFTAYQAAQTELLECDLTSEHFRVRQTSKGIWTGRNNRIHPRSHLVAPLLIGSNTWIDEGVELGPGTVVGSNVVISRQTKIEYSTILDNTYIGQMLHIRGRIVQHDLMINSQSGDYIHLADPLLAAPTFSNEPGGAGRRAVDITLAVLLLVILMPFMLLIAVGAWLESGKVLQQIPSIRHKPLPGGISPMLLLQFPIHNKMGQITNTGKCLAALELQRLPELLNVLAGEMHIVGVKPLPIESAPLLTEEWQQTRNSYLPGFTGLWYIQSAHNESLDEILIADAFYTATNNWFMDLKLLLQTPLAWLRRIRSKSSAMHVRSREQWN